MKKIYLFGALTLGLSLSSCDNISLEDRYIEVERAQSEKVVLLEDFTGIQCVNCPEAAAVITQLHHTYGENFIAVGLHPEGSAFTKPQRRFDLRSKAATEYFNTFKPQTFPTAMIDRTAVNGSVLLENRNTWGTIVNNQLQLTSPVNISMTSEYNTNSRNLKINYDVEFTEDLNEETAFQLWVIENGIIGYQLTGEGANNEYEHNHVLRDAINGYWGEQIAVTAKTGEKFEKSAEMVLDENWVAENCQVVGFVYRKSDYVILQAHLLSIFETENEESHE